MSNKLIWLLRHARADSGDGSMDDIDRPLSHAGRQQAMRLGEWMQQHDLRPAVLISSPAVRARQTTELVCGPLGFDMNNVYFDPGLYLASRKNLVEIIAAQSLSEGSIMLVGHNP
ncbi:MAG: histidine phosphatase family protein, partial [Thiohalophilus sp.]